LAACFWLTWEVGKFADLLGRCAGRFAIAAATLSLHILKIKISIEQALNILIKCSPTLALRQFPVEVVAKLVECVTVSVGCDLFSTFVEFVLLGPGHCLVNV
jgi:hypothetical protein